MLAQPRRTSAVSKVAPDPPRDGRAVRRRRLMRRGKSVRIAIPLVAGVMGLAAAGVVGAAIRFGADIPSLFAKKVKEVEQRFPEGRPQGAVVLTGSSFFQRWETSVADLSPLETINIGISATKIGDQAAYVDRLVVPFQPRAVVVYAGSNDMNAIPLFSKRGSEVATRVQTYLATLHDRLPHAKLFYVAVTESPSRGRVRGDIQVANSLLADYARATDYVTFIDTAATLLTETGGIDESIFGPDRLHFNDKGYDKFAAAIRPVLMDQLG